MAEPLTPEVRAVRDYILKSGWVKPTALRLAEAEARDLLATLDAARPPDELRRLSEAATPGPWTVFGGWNAFRSIATLADSEHQWSVALPGDDSVPSFMRDPEADAAFIVAAVNYVRSLAEPVRSEVDDAS